LSGPSEQGFLGRLHRPTTRIDIGETDGEIETDRPRGTIHVVRQRVIIATLLIGAAVAAQPGWSQGNTRITDSAFTNPGARSIGLGGAFAAIADDATAAFANPAGLVQILRPELSAEIRASASTNVTAAPYEFSGGVSGLGFFSFVYPSRKWAVALYTHQLGSADLTFAGAIPSAREFTVRSYSGAAAFQIGEGLSLGVGLSYFTGDRSSAVESADISDADWGLNAGILWQVAPAWRIAGFYRQGPEFESQSTTGRKRVPVAPFFSWQKIATSPDLTFPDDYGLGVAFRPKDGGLTIGFEWDHDGRAVDPVVQGHTVTEGGTEYHLGIEYAALRWKPVMAFRAGFWLEPGRGRTLVAGSHIAETSSTETLQHLALGFGFAFKRFQIDLGTDISDRAVVGSVSIVYSF
jgi:long-chain fatty acid transport protein